MKKLVNAVLKFLRLRNPVTWGVIFTILLISGFVWVMFRDDCGYFFGCESKWSKLLSANPNEIGDTLAGFAGSLAFLWIIVTVILQSQELREQRKEMQLQRQEFEKMVEAQEAQVTALKAQADIFKDEKRARNESATQKLVEEKLKGIRNELANKKYQEGWELEVGIAKWGEIYKTPSASDGNDRDLEGGNTMYTIPSVSDGKDIDTFFTEFLECVDDAYYYLEQMLRQEKIISASPDRLLYSGVKEEIEAITQLYPELGKDQVARMENMKLKSLVEQLNKLLGLKIWSQA